MEQPDRTSRERIPKIMWIVLTLTITIAAIIAVPAAVRAYRSSGLDELVREYRRTAAPGISESAPIYQASLYFLAPEENGTLSLNPVSVETDSRSGLNGLLERLLAGPALSQLENGNISLIPEGTELIGTSTTDGAAYIELSKEFLSVGLFGREGTDFACRQVTATAQSLPFVRESMILVDGSVVYYNDGLTL